MQTKTTPQFKKAYSELNKEQQVAVDTIDGPVMVIAGPGTGKTRTITLRIANILQKTDTPPNAILALTFTESAAKEMRNRLRKLIGRVAYYVNVSTFHSFCTDIIRQNPEQFRINPSTEPLNELEKVKIIHNIIDNSSFEYLRPVNAPYLYTKAILKAVSDLKREAVNPQELKQILKDKEENLANEPELTKSELRTEKKNLGKNKELLKIYKQYQKTLKKNSWFDFEDMINLVTEKFQTNQDLLRKYQERYHYFLVDEYQDTNNAQNEVVNQLASFWGEDANVFVVGDPSQSIFRFQGASLENTVSFLKQYSQATIITLKNNYRSNQKILDAAYHLISENKLRIEDFVEKANSHLKAELDLQPEKIKVAELSDSPREVLFIARRIKKLIDNGVSPEEIAVIYRNNKDAQPISRALVKMDINYLTQGGGNTLEYPVVQQIIKILRVIKQIRDKEEDLDLFTILHYNCFNVKNLDILKLSRAASRKKSNIFKLLQTEDLSEFNLENEDKIKDAFNKLLSWEEKEPTNTFSAFFELVLNESGFLQWILKHPDAPHLLNRINTLFNEIKRMNSADHQLNLEKFLENIDLMETNYLKIPEPTFSSQENAVTLTTAHSAKGLEWEHVFIYKTYDGQWGNKRTWNLISLPSEILSNTDVSKKEQNEDERRLFYVALTRGKKTVTVTYAQRYYRAGQTKEVVPSMFLTEIPDQLKQPVKTIPLKDQAKKQLKNILELPPQIITPEEKENNFLKDIIDGYKLSPTALNTYLTCPYKFKLNNLLKVPRAKKPYFAFGTAVHTALEKFNREFKQTNQLPKIEFLLHNFGSALKEEILTTKEFEERLKKGREYLELYYEKYQEKFKPPLFIEKFIGYGPSQVVVKDIPIVGKIDRIDWLDAKAQTVKVTDYKTGKPKSRNQIEGKTKNSDGSYKRQLVFYKLLIENVQTNNMTVKKAGLDFIQPNKRGYFKQEFFAITAEEVKALKETIVKVMEKIRNFEFPRTTDYTNCRRCDFQDHCFPEGIPDLSPEQLLLTE
jgi:DNA helicase-2/ATP-dependent DNA helicase PcrA